MKLIIVACSESKNPERAKALDLYKARQHRLARKAYDADPVGEDVAVYVLSAEHGMVNGDFFIDPYDRKMDAARAAELSACDFNRFVFVNAAMDADEVVVYGGKQYRDIVATWAADFDFPVQHCVGADRGCGDHYSAFVDEVADFT